MVRRPSSSARPRGSLSSRLQRSRVYRLLAALKSRPSCRGGVGVVHLLRGNAGGPGFSRVERVHAVLSRPPGGLDPFRSARSAASLGLVSLPSRRAARDAGAGRAGHGAAVERHLAADGPAKRVEGWRRCCSSHPLADQEPQPDVERDGRVPNELVEASEGVQGSPPVSRPRRNDALPAARGSEPQGLHHSAEPGPIALEQLDNRGPVSRGRTHDQFRNLPLRG